MTRSHRRRMLGIGVGALAVLGSSAGCGGDGDDGASDDTTTTTVAAAPGGSETTAPPATDPVAPVASVAESLEQFVADWNAVNGTAAEEFDTPGITVDPAAFAVGIGPNFTESFAASISPSVIMGGLRDPQSGRLTTVVVSVDPDGETTSGAVVTTLSFLGEPGGLEPLAIAYRDLATARTPGATTYVASGLNDIVLSVQAGAEAGDELITIVAAPLSDEATATAAAELARQAVLNALLAAG